MKGNLPKILILSLCLLGTVTSAFFMWQCKTSMDQLPTLPPLANGAGHGADAVTDGHGAPPSHGESPKKEAGHGEAPKAGEHAEAPKAEGHGEAAKAEGHGEATAAAGHGEPARSPAAHASKGLPLFTIDELYVNVASEGAARTLGLKLELEMFEESNRGLLDSRQAAIRDKIIESARVQDYLKLSSLAGKLYFKEVLVGNLNEYFQQPLIKDIHFSLFYLQ